MCLCVYRSDSICVEAGARPNGVCRCSVKAAASTQGRAGSSRGERSWLGRGVCFGYTTFLYLLIIALINSCKVAAGRQEAVDGGVRRRHREKDEEKIGEGRTEQRKRGMYTLQQTS